MVDCKKLKKQECIDNNTDCLWKVGVGCRNKGSVVHIIKYQFTSDI